MKYRTDLILGKVFCLFIFFYFQDSGLSVSNGLQFYFLLRDSENRELVLPQLSLYFSLHTVFLRLKILYMKFINQRRLTEPGTLTYEKKQISQSLLHDES